MIRRRDFCLGLAAASTASGKGGGRMAVTIDDLPAARRSFVPEELEDFRLYRKANQRFLRAFEKRKAPVAGFVTEGWLPQSWKREDLQVLLEDWLDSGAELGNHTFSHPDLYTVGPQRFQANIILGEPIVSAVNHARRRRLRYFRHPYLHTGREPEHRLQISEFLRERGCETAPVTIDTQDWMFAPIYSWARWRHDEIKAAAVRSDYLRYLGAVLRHMQEVSEEALGREPAQVMLLHANALNFDTIDALLDLLAAEGYSLVSLDEALEDSVYAEDVPPRGSWVHGWREVRGLEPRPDPDARQFLGSRLTDFQMVRRQYPAMDLKRTPRVADA